MWNYSFNNRKSSHAFKQRQRIRQLQNTVYTAVCPAFGINKQWHFCIKNGKAF